MSSFISSEHSFVVLIQGDTPANQSVSLRFVLAAIQKNHKITQVFFQGNAVRILLQTIQSPLEQEISKKWKEIANTVPIGFCASSAVRRFGENIQCREHTPFEASSLMQLLSAMKESDHFIQFP